MTDKTDRLVERLRSPAQVFYEYAADDGAQLREAANRIQQLEADNVRLTEERDGAYERAAQAAEGKFADRGWDAPYRNAGIGIAATIRALADAPKQDNRHE